MKVTRNNKLKESIFIIITLIILIITINNVLSLEIINPQVPTEIQAGNLAELSFNTNTTADNYNIYLDNNLLINANNYSWLTTTQDIGVHTIKFEATINSSTGTTGEEATKEFLTTVKGEAPNFIINEPSQTDYNHTEIPIEVISSEAELCYYTYENNTHTLTKNNNTFTNTFIAKEGISTLTIKCTANYATSEKETLLHIDTEEPQIINKKPSGNLNSNTVNLEIETNEVSTCKYSNKNTTYSEMDLLGEENTIKHSKTINLEDGDYEYFILCKDIYGNLMNSSEKLTFSIKTTPTASIEIEGDNIKKAGNYKITLRTNKELSEIPILTYKFQEEGESKTISLVNTNDNYDTFEGYLIINDEQGEDIGEFSFEGKDKNNNIGTEITSGKIFRVDTIKPKKVTSLKADLTKDKNIALNWFFEGEEDVNYYIYRSTKPGAGLTDYYKGSNNKEFIDTEVEEGATYFYKVAAIDDAGNIGELSDEVEITIRDNNPKIDSRSLLIIEDMQKLITRELLDIKGYSEKFNSEKDLLKNIAIKKLGILDKLNNANLELKTIATNLENLKSSQKSSEEISSELEKYNHKLEELNSKIITNLKIDSSIEYQEIIDQPRLKSISNKFFESNPVNNKEKSIEEANSLLDKIDVNVKTIKITVEDYSNNKKKALLIIKNYNSEEPLTNIFLVESLSEEFKNKKEEIIFNKKPLIITNGLAQYSFSNFQDEELSYYLYTEKDLSEAKESKTVFFKKKEETINSETTDKKEENNNLITGNVLKSKIIENLSTNTFFLIIGVIIIAGLLAYYFKIDSEFEKPPQHSIINNQLNPVLNNSLAMGLASLVNQQSQKNQIIEKKPNTIIVKKLKEDDLNDLIKLARQAIDKHRLFDATYFYKKACKSFEKEDFGSENIKKATSTELQKIYYQLLMMKQIDESHEAIINEDHQKLEWHMNNMRRLSQRIEKNSPLAERASNHYEYFYNQLNKIKAENLGVNIGGE